MIHAFIEKHPILTVLAFFIIQTVLYGLTVLDYIAVVLNHRGPAIFINGVIASASFWTMVGIAETRYRGWAYFGYLGGALMGTLLGMELGEGLR